MMEGNEWRQESPPFAGIPGHGRPFHRGDFKYVLLQLIKDKPSYGYEIIKALRERFYNFYIPSPGSVYPTLQMLEEMGYAKSTDQDGKKVYAITKEGAKLLEGQKGFEERMKHPGRRWWQEENAADILETRRQFERLKEVFKEKARTADTAKHSRIRQALSKAHDAIAEV